MVFDDQLASIGNVSCVLVLERTWSLSECEELAASATNGSKSDCVVDDAMLPGGEGPGPLDFRRAGFEGRRTCWPSPGSDFDPYVFDAVVMVINGAIFAPGSLCALAVYIKIWRKQMTWETRRAARIGSKTAAGGSEVNA